MKGIAALAFLLLSTGILLLGHGMQLTLLPLRAGANGMPEFLIAISASCYFLGFVLGCIAIPRVIARAGHIRSFAVLAAVMISAILSLEMLDHWVVWLLLRLVTGVAISGLYGVIESWLNSEVTTDSRGQVLAIYTFITLAAMAGGQVLINVGPVEAATPFSLAAICIALAIVPVGMTRRLAPAPPESTRIRFRLLYQRSHSAFSGAVLSGIVAGSFWSLGALFASSYSAAQSEVSLFMLAAILGGAIFQYPIGWLSDRFDRRRVLLYLSLASTGGSLAVALSAEQPWFLLAVVCFGASATSLYSVALATAADVSGEHEFVEIGTSVLLLHALGGAVAPLALGPLMSLFGPVALFWSFAVLCSAFSVVLYILTRAPRAIAVGDQVPFEVAAPDAAPIGFDMDPRGAEQSTDEDEPSALDATVDVARGRDDS